MGGAGKPPPLPPYLGRYLVIHLEDLRSERSRARGQADGTGSMPRGGRSLCLFVVVLCRALSSTGRASRALFACLHMSIEWAGEMYQACLGGFGLSDEWLMPAPALLALSRWFPAPLALVGDPLIAHTLPNTDCDHSEPKSVVFFALALPLPLPLPPSLPHTLTLYRSQSTPPSHPPLLLRPSIANSLSVTSSFSPCSSFLRAESPLLPQ